MSAASFNAADLKAADLKAADLKAACWPVSQLGEALEELARRAGLLDRRNATDLTSLPPAAAAGIAANFDELESWVENAAEYIGLEAESIRVGYAEVETALRLAGPLLIWLPGEQSSGLDSKVIAILRASKRKVFAIAPSGKLCALRPSVLRDVICKNIEAPIESSIDQLLDEAGVSSRRRARVKSALLGERLMAFDIPGWWLLRLPPGASFARQMRRASLPGRFAALIGAQVAQYLILLGSWWVVGAGALQGQMDRGWLMAWVLLLFTMVPFRLLITWLQGMISIQAGGLLKQRLLYGALRLDSEDIRRDGSGQLLGRVIESSAVEALALGGGFMALAAAIEMVMAVAVLAVGAGGALHALLFVCWVGAGLFLGRRYYRDRDGWTETRLAMTNDLVERMVGHRTRLAQQAREHWHEGEDETLAQYLSVSRSMDDSSVLLTALVPRGWLVLGLIGLAPSLISGAASTAGLAVSIGGMLLGYQALGRLTGSLSQLATAIIAWQQVAVLFSAAGRAEVNGSPAVVSRLRREGGEGEDKRKLIEAHDLTFRYGDRDEAVLRHCSLAVYAGDHLLLEGPSGGGKSTLASLLVGLRFPDSGLLLLEGMDYQTLGARGWRRRITASPQFHENHILTETFAFNLLMGRRWPPRSDDFREAEEVCRELGLGPLLERMPAGLLQMIGETGWQLSHGERSRLFIARALLQGADLIVLDESFAALDPETLALALRCVLARSSTLVVIAHP
jgi:ATP-binding cassette subfamily B protein